MYFDHKPLKIISSINVDFNWWSRKYIGREIYQPNADVRSSDVVGWRPWGKCSHRWVNVLLVSVFPNLMLTSWSTQFEKNWKNWETVDSKPFFVSFLLEAGVAKITKDRTFWKGRKNYSTERVSKSVAFTGAQS